MDFASWCVTELFTVILNTCFTQEPVADINLGNSIQQRTLIAVSQSHCRFEYEQIQKLEQIQKQAWSK